MEEEKKDLPFETVFVHNVVRSVTTRVTRTASGVRRKNQTLGGGELRLIRNRPTELRKDLFLKYLGELRRGVKEGRLEVRTRDGALVNLDSFEVGSAPVSPPLPNPPLDSIKNDPPYGGPMPQFPGGQTPDYSSEEEGGIPGSIDSQTEEPPQPEKTEEEGEEPPPGLESQPAAKEKKGKRR